MNQSKDYTLHTRESDIKKIGHNLDASLLNLSAEVYSGQQVSIFGNLSLTQPLFEEQISLQNTSHFETLPKFTTAHFHKKEIFYDSSMSYSISNDINTLTSKVEYQE